MSAEDILLSKPYFHRHRSTASGRRQEDKSTNPISSPYNTKHPSGKYSSHIED